MESGKSSARRRQRAQSLVEFAISVPLLLLTFAIAVDFARVYYYDLTLRDAAFAAARYAGMNANDDAGIVNAAVSASPAGTIAGADVAIAQEAGKPRGTGTWVKVTVTYTFHPITPMATSLLGGDLRLLRDQTSIIK